MTFHTKSLQASNPCGGLNEKGLHKLMCLNTWSPVGGIVWERLGGVTLLEICHWEWALRFQKRTPLALSASLLVDQM